jgi:hypothetical protein
MICTFIGYTTMRRCIKTCKTDKKNSDCCLLKCDAGHSVRKAQTFLSKLLPTNLFNYQLDAQFLYSVIYLLH